MKEPFHRLQWQKMVPRVNQGGLGGKMPGTTNRDTQAKHPDIALYSDKARATVIGQASTIRLSNPNPWILENQLSKEASEREKKNQGNHQFKQSGQ